MTKQNKPYSDEADRKKWLIVSIFVGLFLGISGLIIYNKVIVVVVAIFVILMWLLAIISLLNKNKPAIDERDRITVLVCYTISLLTILTIIYLLTHSQ